MSREAIDRRECLRALAGAAATALALPARAGAGYPDRPVTLIVPWAEGGGTDTAARLLATLLTKALGKPFNVTNRTGGTGLVGHQAIASADPDGYTLGFVTTEIAIQRLIGETELSVRDFTPISMINQVPAALLVAADSPWRALNDVVAAIREEPGRYHASGSGVGRIWHVAYAGLLRAAKLDTPSAPWVTSQGAARALQGLAAGEVDLVCCSFPDAYGPIDAGQARPLVVMDGKRNSRYPDVPTVKEAIGVDWQARSFLSVMGPRGVLPAVVAKLDQVIATLLKSQEWVGFAAERGYEPSYMDAPAVDLYVQNVESSAAPVLREMGLSHD